MVAVSGGGRKVAGDASPAGAEPCGLLDETCAETRTYATVSSAWVLAFVKLEV